MKTKIKVLLVMLSLVIASCGPNYKQQAEELRIKNDSLSKIIDGKTSEIMGYMEDLTNIQTAINQLTLQEEILKESSEKTMDTETKYKILADIDAIKELINRNKKKLAEVQAKLKRSNARISELEKMIASLNEGLQERDSSISVLSNSITVLSNKVAVAEHTIAEVRSDNEAKTKEIASKTAKLNTAYYTVGTYKTLREKQVISKGAIFRSKNINPDLNTEVFTKIDVTNTKVIALNYVKEAKLTTTHPTDSYTVVKENNRVKEIEITNPERFWASSKYLVVVTQ